MKRKRFSEEQIITILKQAEGGLPVPELIRQHGICEGTTAGRASTAGWNSTRPSVSNNSKMRTAGLSGWWPIRRWTSRSSRGWRWESTDARRQARNGDRRL